MALLLQTHVEFQIVTPRTLQAFNGDVLILPEVRCVGETEINLLTSYLKSAKSLIVTGETGKYNEQRQTQAENPIHKLLGIRSPFQEASSAPQSKFIYQPNCPGRAYLRQLTEEFNDVAVDRLYQKTRFNLLKEQFSKQLTDTLKYSSEVEVLASPFVSAQIARVDGRSMSFWLTSGA